MKIKIFNIPIEVSNIILPIIYIILGIIAHIILKNIIKRITKEKNVLKEAQKQRIETLRSITINIIRYFVIFFVILAILSQFGINVKSILAGLGIGTAIIGLAFQDIAKDLIAGFSIITEGEYEVGDTIEVDDFMGEVVSIGLRTTRIRNFKGATKIIANHYMDNIINYSDNNSLAVVDVAIAYECKEEKIEKTFQELFNKLEGKIPNATKKIELWGMNEMDDSAVVYRVAVETKPMKHIATERFLRKEIKKAFDEAGIKIPYTQIEVHNGR